MCTSELAFSVALNAGALPLVTNLTQDSSDVLLQLNALELLEKASRGEKQVSGNLLHVCLFERLRRGKWGVRDSLGSA